MIDGSEVCALALEDFGQPAAINGAEFPVLACLTRDAAMESGFMDVDGPFILARKADAEAAGIVYGDAGDQLVVAGRTYTVKHVSPDALGLVLILLGGHYDE